MKAAVYYRYGTSDEIHVSQVDKPIPKPGEVLVQVYAASVNAYDWRLLKADPFITRIVSGFFSPKNNILGADIAGVVAAIGGESKFHIGDEVFGCLEGCGKGGLAVGGFAEYACIKDENLAHKPSTLSFSDAAALPMAAVTALQAVRDYARLAKGQSVLINGASGGVGVFAIQIAKAFGAVVTGVCGTDGADMIRSLGADVVIDYKKENAVNGSVKYDVVIDVAATLSVKEYRRALKPNGVCVIVGFSTIWHMLSYSYAGRRNGKKIVLCAANNKISGDLLEICKFVETGRLKVVIDSRYALRETEEALRHAETGHPKGKVIIMVNEQ